MSQFRCALALLLASLPGVLSAQGSAPSRIAGIVIERASVFDAAEADSWIPRLINRLHVTTRHEAVARELLFAVGDVVDTVALAETERNLRRLGVFRSVSLDTIATDSGVVVRIVTGDGWTTRADFRINTSGEEIDYTVALIEDNLLGTVTRAQLMFRRDPDRTTTTLHFRQPRLIAGTIGASAALLDRSDGRVVVASIGQPFFATTSRLAATIDLDLRRERVLGFHSGHQVARDTMQRRYALGRVNVERALIVSPGGYLRAGVTAQVRRDDYLPQSTWDTLGRFPERRVSGAVGLTLEARRGDYLKVRGFRSFVQDEDIDLSLVVRASAMLAPRPLGYLRDGLAPAVAAQVGLRVPHGFVRGELVANGLFTSEGLDSGRVELGVTAALMPAPRHLLVLYAGGGVQHRPLPGANFDMGLGLGPRGFPAHAFTGDRQYLLSAEYRHIVVPSLFRMVGLGVAGFADHGGATWHGSPMRSGSDVGVGLRVVPTRANDQEVARLDLAWRFANDRLPAGWSILLGKGFVFGSRR